MLSQGRWLWLRATAWALVLSAGVFGCFIASQSLAQWLHLPDRFSYAVALVVPLVTFWLYATLVRFAEKRVATEVQFGSRSALATLVGFVGGTCMIAVTLGLLWALGLYHIHLNHWSRWYDSFIFDSYISAMLEELLFRAILLRVLSRAFGIGWGLALSSICFGAAHLGHASLVSAFEIALNGGVLLGLLYLATGKIWMAIGFHLAWDFVEESVLGVNSHSGLLISTPVSTKPVLLTGGSFGPDGSLFAGLIGLAFVLGCLRLSRSSAFLRLR